MIVFHSPDHLALGRALREFRARRGLSQESFGSRAGMHRNYVGAIEPTAKINPTFKVLLELARGLDVPLSRPDPPLRGRVAEVGRGSR